MTKGRGALPWRVVVKWKPLSSPWISSKRLSVQQLLSLGAPPPFVISTGAQRSGEISVWILFLGNVFERSALASLFRRWSSLGLVVQGVDDFAWLGVAQDDPGLVFNGIGIGLQMLHVVLQAAILLLQVRGSLSAAPGAGGASAGNRLSHWLQKLRDTPTQPQSLWPQWLLPGGRNEKDTMRCPASQWPRSLLLYLLNERVFCVHALRIRNHTW